MLFIVGTDHDIQRGSQRASPAAIATFRELIDQLISDEELQIAFEEMHESERWVEATICERVCRKKRNPIPVRFIDLSREERERMSIDSWPDDEQRLKQIRDWMNKSHSAADESAEEYSGSQKADTIKKLSHGVRERVWLAQMIKADKWPALFVCGANHVESLACLCSELNLDSQVIYNVQPDEEAR